VVEGELVGGVPGAERLGGVVVGALEHEGALGDVEHVIHPPSVA
jgi:hypothetical protein